MRQVSREYVNEVIFGVLKGGLKCLGAAMLGRVRPVVLVESPCRGWLADRDDTWALRTARPVEGGRLKFRLTARRVRKEDDAVLEKPMFLYTVCVVQAAAALHVRRQRSCDENLCRLVSNLTRSVLGIILNGREHIPHAGPTHRSHSFPVNLCCSILSHIIATIIIEANTKK